MLTLVCSIPYVQCKTYFVGFYKYNNFDEYKLEDVLITEDAAATEGDKLAKEECFWSKSFLLR